MAIKFSQFNLRTDHTSGMYLVGYDGNQNIHITVDNLFDDFINGTENTIAMFGTNGTVLADSILSQDAGATLLTVAGQLNVDAAATFDTSITVTGDSTLNGNVTLGDASTDLITQNGTLYLNGPVKDTTDTLGAVDQVLLSDATGELTFTDLADLHVGGAEVVEVPVKNVQGSALVKGDPVYISGSVGASGRLEVQLADASNTLKMPAVGLLKQDLADNAEGFAVVTGKLRNLITDPIDGVNPTENDVIYVKPLGTSGAALTTTKPVYGNFIQNIGKVGRVSTAADGNLVVSSILRTNDIPNLTPGRLWIGSNGNTIESQTLFVDEANARLGVGTANPSTALDVRDGGIKSIRSSAGWAGIFQNDGSSSGVLITAGVDSGDAPLLVRKQDTTEIFSVRGNGTSYFQNGNVGIGTISPARPLHVNGAGTNFVAEFQSTDDKASILIQDDDTLNYIHSQDSYLSLGGQNALSANNLNINSSSGNVGIGTTSPSQKLHVNSGVTNTVAIFESTDTEAQVNFVDTTGTSSIRTRNDFRFNSGNTELVRFESGGNVGIGTTSPSTKLEVAGSVGNFQTTGHQIFLTRNGNNEIYAVGASSVLALGTNSAEKMRIDSAGNVGIGGVALTGWANKQVVLDSGSDVSAAFVMVNDTTGRTGTDGSVITLSGSDMYLIQRESANMIFRTANTERMRIDSSGYVGINTSSPGANLDVNGQIRLTSAGQELQFANHNVGAYRDTNNRLVLAGYNGIDFNAESVASGMDSQTRRMRIKPSGQIQFDEYGAGAFTGTAAKTLAVDTNGNIIETANASIDGSGTANYVTKWFDTDTITDSVIYDDGTNVGIGTTNPSQKLDVSGRIRASHNTSNYYEIGASSAGGFVVGKSGGVETVNIRTYGDSHFTGGNVGIGTTSPSAKLEIRSTSSTKQLRLSTGATTYWELGRSTSTGHFEITEDSGDTYFLIDKDNGNVGIGETSPDSLLTVGGDFTATTAKPTVSVSDMTNGGSLGIRGLSPILAFDQTSTGVPKILMDGGGLEFKDGTLDSQGSVHLKIDSSGFVGIGTTSPNTKLDVRRSSNGIALELHQTSGSANDFVDMKMVAGNTSAGNFGTILRHARQGTDGGDFSILTSPTLTGTPVERLRVTKDGSVGIGTASPSQKLEIRSETATHKLVSINRPASDVAALYVGNDSASPSNGVISSNYSDLIFGRDQSGVFTEHMRIERDGNVGIGTTSPGATLHVESSSPEFRMSTSGVGKVRFRMNGNNYINTGQNFGIGTTSPASKLDVNGGIRMADDSSTASASNVGTLRYRTSGNNSYVDMCMQTGASTYAWVNIVQNNW